MKYRVLVVDDSAYMRNLIADLIGDDPELEAVGFAKEGREAVDKVKSLRPDVVALDVELPDLNHIDALERMMRECPVPVVMLGTHSHFGASETISALQAGAVDFIAKPVGAALTGLSEFKKELAGKLKAAALVPVDKLREWVSAPFDYFPGMGNPLRLSPEDDSVVQMIAIGASAVGSRSLRELLGPLPADFPHPIVVVQHMPSPFTAAQALQLNKMTALRVVEARDGQSVRGGFVYIAPGESHTKVVQSQEGFRIALSREPPRSGHRPSVDELFDSVSKLSLQKRHFVLLAGKGKDGAQELANAKRSGASSTYAESMQSCAACGMPRAAIDTGAVDYILTPAEIADKLIQLSIRQIPT
ncbi:chemotaxis-specific protein-glutamate methyltransferase CheB [Cohnella suwonensis]|uniref:Protein-glutamate methylesterase/protein-glutamine glutaminase n=1 Tax=Cohnella suwonensis TaxID=696072 RepID=A0ABW0M462_9BACL